MAITRIKTDNITNSAVTTDKLANKSVTAGKLEDNLTYGSDLIVSGDLTVMGTTTTVESTTVTVADPLLVLGAGQTGPGAIDAGLVIERGSDTNVALIWDESENKFVAVYTAEDGTTSGNVTISSYADFEIAALTASAADAGNIHITGNTISSTNGNGDINLTPDGLGAVVVSAGHELQISDLTQGRLLIVGANGALADSSALSFDTLTSKLTVTSADIGNMTFSGTTISSTGDIVLDANSGAGVVDASGSVVTGLGSPTNNSDAATKYYVDQAVSAGGSTINQDDSGIYVTDDGNNPGLVEIKADGSTIVAVNASGVTVTGYVKPDNLSLSGNTLTTTNANGNLILDANGTGKVEVDAPLQINSLTAGRVLFAGNSGVVVDDGGFTYNASTDTASIGAVETDSVKVSTLSSGKVVFATTNGQLTSDTDLSYDSNSDTLTALNIVASTTMKVSGLTSGGIVVADTDGQLADYSSLTFNSGLVTTGDLTLSTSHGTGALSAVNGTFSSLSATRVVFAGTGGLLKDDADLTFDTSTNTLNVGGDIVSAADVSGDTLTATTLTSGRVVIVGAGGTLDDDSVLTFSSGTLEATNLTATSAVTTGTLDVNTSATLASATIEDLTSGRIVFAGAGGLLVDDADLTYNSTTNTLSVGNLNASNIDLSSVTLSSLTAGRVVFAGSGGTLDDDAALTFNSGTGELSATSFSGTDLSVTNASVSSLTSGRVVLAGSAGALTDDSGLTYNAGTLTVSTVVADVTGTVSSISNHDTDDLSEGTTNLYFTNSRARSAISVTGDLNYDSGTGVISYSTPNTDGITEGTTNLFFTQSRARNSLAAGTGVSYDNTTGTISIGQAVGTTDSVTFNQVTADVIGNVTGDLTGTVQTASQPNITSLGTLTGLTMGGNIAMGTYYITGLHDPANNQDAATKKYVDDSVSNITNLSFSDGTNSDTVTIGVDTLTFAGTANEIETAVTNNTVTIGLPSNVTIGNDLTVTGNVDAATGNITGALDVGGNFAVATSKFTVNATSGDTVVAGTLDVTGNVTLSGDLTVNGTTTTVNAANLNVTDKNITLADGAVNAAAADGAGITIDGANATFTYTSADDRWNLNKDLNVAMVYGDLTGSVTGTVSSLSNHDTDDLGEGTTNLYFTQSRARNSISATGWTNLTYNSTTGVIDISAPSTDDVTEGSNLYFTNTRARNAISVTDSGGDGSMSYDSSTGVITYTGPSASEVRAHLSSGTGVNYDNTTGTISIGQSVGTTDNVTFNQVTADVIGTVSSLSNHDTDDLSEGLLNLYFTNTRARNALAAGTGVSYDSSTGTFSIGQAVGTNDSVTFDTITANTINANLNGNLTGNFDGVVGANTPNTGTFTTLASTNLTATRLVFSNVSNELVDDADLTWDTNTNTLSVSNVSSTGNGTFDSVTVSGLTQGRIVYTGVNGALTGEAGFEYDASTNTMSVGSISATDITMAVADTRVLYSNSGAITGNINFTFDSATHTLSVSNVSATGQVSADSVSVTDAYVSTLTQGRVTYAGVSGQLIDDSNFTFDGTTDTLTVSNIVSSGNIEGGTVTATGLTSGRVVFATSGGELSDDSTFTFNPSTDTLDVSNLYVGSTATLAGATISSLTSGRVVLAGTSGELVDSTNLQFDTGTGALTVTGSLAIDNISINGNTISTTDSNGNLVLSPDGTGYIDASTSLIKNVVDPVGAQDAATKAYVDNALSNNVTIIQENNTSVEVVDNNITAGVIDVTVDGTLTARFGGTSLEINNALDVDNININGNTISSTDTNGNITLDPQGTGVVDVASAIQVNTLTSGRIVYVGSNGRLLDESGFEYDDSTDTLSVPNATISSALTLSTFTQGNVLFVGANGVVSEDSDITWTGGDLLTINGRLQVNSMIDVNNLNLQNNTISTTDTNGNLILQPNGTGATVVNDAGNSSDFIVRSVNQTHMLFVDTSADVIGIKTSTPNAEAALHIASTDSMIVPVGTQAQRPGTATAGMFRFNTTSEKLEVYDGTNWVSIGANTTTTVTSETFAGDGTEVNFTLAQTTTSASVVVSINGVVQIPGTAYSVSGTTLTFTEAPEAGDSIEVRLLVTTETVQTVIGSDDGSSLITYDPSGDQFVFTVANSTIAIVDSQGIDLRSGAAIICGDAATSVGTSATVVDTFAKASYRVAKYVCQIANSGLGEFQACEILVVHNGTTATVTEYAEVHTGSASLGSFSAVINGSNVEVKFTGANAGNAVKVMPTYIKA